MIEKKHNNNENIITVSREADKSLKQKLYKLFKANECYCGKNNNSQRIPFVIEVIIRIMRCCKPKCNDTISKSKLVKMFSDSDIKLINETLCGEHNSNNDSYYILDQCNNGNEYKIRDFIFNTSNSDGYLGEVIFNFAHPIRGLHLKKRKPKKLSVPQSYSKSMSFFKTNAKRKRKRISLQKHKMVNNSFNLINYICFDKIEIDDNEEITIRHLLQCDVGIIKPIRRRRTNWTGIYTVLGRICNNKNEFNYKCFSLLEAYKLNKEELKTMLIVKYKDRRSGILQPRMKQEVELIMNALYKVCNNDNNKKNNKIKRMRVTNKRAVVGMKLSSSNTNDINKSTSLKQSKLMFQSYSLVTSCKEIPSILHNNIDVGQMTIVNQTPLQYNTSLTNNTSNNNHIMHDEEQFKRLRLQMEGDFSKYKTATIFIPFHLQVLARIDVMGGEMKRDALKQEFGDRINDLLRYTKSPTHYLDYDSHSTMFTIRGCKLMNILEPIWSEKLRPFILLQLLL